MLEEIRRYDFDEGAETSAQPDAGTPAAANDIVTKSYVDSLTTASVTGSIASPSAIVAGSGIAFTGSIPVNVWFIKGSGGAVNISANPQIAAGNVVGQRLILIGTHDTDTVLIEDGNGLKINEPMIMKAGSIIELVWAGASYGWTEIARNFIQGT